MANLAKEACIPTCRDDLEHLSSPLWPAFVLRNLSHLQRDTGDADYSRFIDQIGDGEVESSYSADRDTQLMKLEPMAVTQVRDTTYC